MITAKRELLFSFLSLNAKRPRLVFSSLLPHELVALPGVHESA